LKEQGHRTTGWEWERQTAKGKSISLDETVELERRAEKQRWGELNNTTKKKRRNRIKRRQRTRIPLKKRKDPSRKKKGAGGVNAILTKTNDCEATNSMS